MERFACNAFPSILPVEVLSKSEKFFPVRLYCGNNQRLGLIYRGFVAIQNYKTQ